MTPNPKTELRPCPFCGGAPTLSRLLSGPFIHCKNEDCRACAEVIDEDCIRIWNTRAESALEAENAELKRIIEEAGRIVQDFAKRNPKHIYNGVEQDPFGAHRLVEEIASRVPKP